MSDTDRALLAAIRGRELQVTGMGFGWAVQAAEDRRELLRIIDDLEAAANVLIEAVLDRPFVDPDDGAAQAARALRRLLPEPSDRYGRTAEMIAHQQLMDEGDDD